MVHSHTSKKGGLAKAMGAQETNPTSPPQYPAPRSILPPFSPDPNGLALKAVVITAHPAVATEVVHARREVHEAGKPVAGEHDVDEVTLQEGRGRGERQVG